MTAAIELSKQPTVAVAKPEPAPAAPHNPRTALEPRSMNEGLRLAGVVAASGMFGVKSAEEAFLRMAIGMSLGLSAMQSLMGIHVIENGGTKKGVLSSDLMAGVCIASDACEYFECVESTGTVATYRTKRKGQRGEQRLSFTLEQAKAAGLASKDVWKKYPDAMLRARCIAALARMAYPDLLTGVYTPEELGDARHAEQAAGASLNVVPSPPQARPSPAVPHDAVTGEVLEDTTELTDNFAERYAAATSLDEVGRVRELAKAAYDKGQLSKADITLLAKPRDEAIARVVSLAKNVAEAPAKPVYGSREQQLEAQEQ